MSAVSSMMICTQFPLRQIDPGGQQNGAVVVPQSRGFGQHPDFRQVHPGLQQVGRPSGLMQHVVSSGQQVARPVGPTQQRCFGGQQNRPFSLWQTCSCGQHLPLMQTLPSGQQNRAVAFSHTCRRGQQRPCTQIVPSGQHIRPPAVSWQICSRGQHLPSTQYDPSGQQTSVPSAETQICFSRQHLPLMHLVPGGQHVADPVSGSRQQSYSGGQQSPCSGQQHFSSGRQQLSPHGCESGGHPTHSPVAGSHIVPGGQQVFPQTRVSGQQIVRGGAPGIAITMHFVPGGQHMPCPSDPMQHDSSRRQQRPIDGSQQFDSGGQHPLPQSFVSGHGAQPLSVQMVPGGQQILPPVGVAQTCVDGQHMRKVSDGSGRQSTPGGQHVAATPLPAGLLQHVSPILQQTVLSQQNWSVVHSQTRSAARARRGNSPPSIPVPTKTPTSRSTSRRDTPLATLRESSSKKFFMLASYGGWRRAPRNSRARGDQALAIAPLWSGRHPAGVPSPRLGDAQCSGTSARISRPPFATLL
jgi:hypothetical protein